MLEKYFFENDKLIILDENLDINISSSLKVELKYIFYSTGSIKAKMHYYKNVLHGTSSFFDKDNNLISISYYYLGKKFGKSYKYYKSKKLYSIEQYIDDKLEKEQKYFYENGSLKTCLFYIEGVLHKGSLFYENKKIKRSFKLKGNKVIENKLFDIREKPIDESKFKL
ncbi:MAG: hypothetical protein K1060chlam5_00676 [Candidatus Anoxychlamydiales bacterium]|nr:hypothetical protein [Candidatus Anoxychlamydiales bacterium]